MKKKLVILGMSVLVLSLLFAGCGSQQQTANDPAAQNNKPETVKVKIYVPNDDVSGIYLKEVEVDKKATEGKTPQEVVTATLFKPGNLGRDEATHKGIVPPQTKLLKSEVKDGVLYADFSKELTQLNVGSSGDACVVASIVNSLLEIEGINYTKVQILIEGKVVESIAGHVSTNEPLGKDTQLIIKQ